MLHMDRFFWNSKDDDASLYPFRTDVRVQAFEQSSQVHPQSLFSQQTFSTIKIISFPGVTFNMTTRQPRKLGKCVVKSFPGILGEQFCEGNSPGASSSYAACSVALAIHLKSAKVIGVIGGNGGFRQKHWWFGTATFSRSEAWWFLKLCN